MDRSLEELLTRHRGKITGIILGLVFSWLIIRYGIFKTIFIAVCIVLGYFIGKRADEKFDFKEFWHRIFKER